MKNQKVFARWVIVILISIIAVGLVGLICYVKQKKDDTSANIETPVHFTDFNIKELGSTRLPYSWTTPVPLEPAEPHDEQGVILYTWKDGKNYYHPVQISSRILEFIASYLQTNDSEYIRQAEVYAQALLDRANEINGALYFPYNYDFLLHGYEEDKMVAPWYSGMAQGKALSAFIRLYKVTNQEKYLSVADKILLSFTKLKDEGDPWVAYRDAAGYYWIEEYPMNEPDHTLNGFGFAIYGLYDYYIVKKDAVSKNLLQESLATIKEYLPQFRNVGEKSSYCLKHRLQKGNYHYIHIRQVRTMYYITEDDFFKTMMDNLVADYYEE